MARRSRDNRNAWIGVIGMALPAMIAGFFGVWQSNRPKEKPQLPTVGTVRDIIVNHGSITYDHRRENTSSGQKNPKTGMVPTSQGLLPDKTHPTQSTIPEPVGKKEFLFYGLSAPEEALLSSDLKRVNAVSAVISVADGAYAGSQNAFVKVSFTDGSVYEDSFGVPTNNPGAAISRQLETKFTRRK